MEHQIILLPSDNYWDWVKACHQYVMHYGANLTQDPGTAARYMAPAQVITFPVHAGAYPEQGDIEAWFQENFPGIRLDPIPVESPKDIEQELNLRVEQTDRYGQKRRPFYLLWPTDYAVITQKFGANPHIYTRFGMPGHEGVDIRALNNTNIYCCADGEVYQVHKDPKSHPYGLHVRVRHKDGYKTVYAHLAQPLVKLNQKVSAGEIIGKANSTGASTGSHLHLTLKRDGATKRGETKYPKDVIDPTPFLVWPERQRKSMPRKIWPAGKCLSGVSIKTKGRIDEDDFDLLEKIKPEAVVVRAADDSETLERIKSIVPSAFLLGTVNGDFSGDPITPEQFLKLTQHDVARHYKHGVRHFEICSDPNVQAYGYGRSWKSGSEFASWFEVVVTTLRSIHPDAQFGFPGLSPGEDIPGWRDEHWRFLRQAEAAVTEADWIGVHAYWIDDLGMRSPEEGRIFDFYQNAYPEKMILITEYNNPLSRLTSTQRAEQYHQYLRMIRKESRIGAAFLYALSGDDEQLDFILDRKDEDRRKWVEILQAELD